MNKRKVFTILSLISIILIGLGMIYLKPKECPNFEKIILEKHKNISYNHSISVHFDYDAKNKKILSEFNDLTLNLKGIIDDYTFYKKYQLDFNKKNFILQRINTDDNLIISIPAISKKTIKPKIKEDLVMDSKIFRSLLNSSNDKNCKTIHQKKNMKNCNKDCIIQMINENQKVHELFKQIVNDCIKSREIHNLVLENYKIKNKLINYFEYENKINTFLTNFKSTDIIFNHLKIINSKVELHFDENTLENVSIEALCKYRIKDNFFEFKIVINSNFYNKNKSQIENVTIK